MCLDECSGQVQILIKVFSMVYIGHTLTLLTISTFEMPVRVVIGVSIDIASRFLSMFIGFEPLFFLFPWKESSQSPLTEFSHNLNSGLVVRKLCLDMA
jgi:hypothetical protein